MSALARIFSVRRVVVAVILVLLVGAIVTFDVPYRVWYRLGGDSGTSDLMVYTVVYRVSGDGEKTVTFRTPSGDLTETMNESASREVRAWSNGEVARISVQGGLTGGSAGCEILVNGIPVDTDSATGPQAVATCNARVQ